MGILLFLPVILGIAAAFGLAALARSRSAVSGDHLIITKVFRRLLGWRVGGFVLGIASAVAVPFIAVGLFDVDSPVVILIWVPAVLALVYLVSLSIGERLAYRPASERRSATLTARAAGRYLSVRDAVVPLIATLGFATLAAATLAVTNDQGNVEIVCASPYPGDSGSSAHSSIDDASTWAALGLVVVAAALAALVARTATNRARPDQGVFAAAEDDALRRSTIRAGLGIYTAFAAIMGAVFTLALADILTSDFAPCTAPSWWHPVGVALGWSLIGWLGVYTWSVVQIVARPVATRTFASIG
ncbi:hypothetical protein [Gordonia phthalatica]|uniref:Uncharacterized protein n=1 Tax=Gordonia phthalatica TaxID=1136941 RepID=A0A0N9NCU4_9ACTN|nr:hypothetical protein [Gordonia phthalatica]ALG85518.1 hypothetical protein ACH46_14870 [Gordonia phthalatica]